MTRQLSTKNPADGIQAGTRFDGRTTVKCGGERNDTRLDWRIRATPGKTGELP